MSDEGEVDKVLGRATELRKALGRPWAVFILLVGLWAVRRRAGLWATIASGFALLIVGWLKITSF
ncbi:hypothetical protein [Bradyrhizobium sp.]|jgi:hypothetical protein|uniref:hypothetical protein n=1 Tax=Bradyrhizobium sp. TaxID=376 RepID=UPI002DFBCF95|nr:hypothetical protein [Bradyrhizobium sp.]